MLFAAKILWRYNIKSKIWHISQGNGSLVATAIHDGHEIRDEVAEIIALSETARLREEDPFTSHMTTIAETRLIVSQSRFEVDLNRPREKAVYLEPKDSWGLQVWKSKPSPALIKRSLEEYDAFYNTVYQLFSELQHRFKRFVVFDIHSYNHHRDGMDKPAADPTLNPEVNIGTGTMNREYWAPIIERFISDLRAFDFLGRHLDVRENVKFKGGNFPRWIHEKFPNSACAISIEFKKFFMNEWTGELIKTELSAIRDALKSTVPGIMETLDQKY